MNSAIPRNLEAFDPTGSAWVAASAGSGKTTLLTNRVLRLLLEATTQKAKPPAILCLTYTRAATAEMQNRIYSRLEGWAVASDEDIDKELRAIFDLTPTKDLIMHARRLFAAVLDDSFRVRVMTVHAFCQYVLHRFPLEAGVSPHFRLLEGEAANLFHNRLFTDFMAEVAKSPDLQAALNVVAENKAASTVQEMLHEMLENQPLWEKFWRERGRDYAAKLSGLTGLHNETEESILADAIKNTPITRIQIMAKALGDAGGTLSMDSAEIIASWLADEKNRAAHFHYYVRAYLTKENEPNKRLPVKAMVTDYPDEAEEFRREALRVQAVMQRLALARFHARQVAFIQLARRLFDMQAALKQEQGVLSYDDLIAKTRAVLTAPGISGWVLYKLDFAIDHILVDEAQDTSPAQWDIVLALLEDFLSGAGAREETTRTVFVVGDEKQSIFSFQGADRANYLQVRDVLLARLKASERKVTPIRQHASFRTASAVLDFVDAVFAEEEAREGVSDEAIRHVAARTKAPGFVELWPPLEPEDAPPMEPWTPPLAREDYKPVEVKLAERIAATIKGWLDDGLWLSSENRPLDAGDVMILLQSRKKFLFPIVRALKDAGIPIAGVDRMVLAEQAAVQDVLAMCRFLLLPQDDLTLAEILRGPFIRISDDELFKLAYNRAGSLWDAVQQNAGIADYLRLLLAQTDFIGPYELISQILFRACPADALSGRHALTSALGPDAIDPLDELLAAALEFQTQQSSSLQLFVHAISHDDRQIKRELSTVTGQVRVLTVHGAKGLEAPIVFVPDLLRDPTQGENSAAIVWNEDGLPLNTGDDAPPLAAAKTGRDELVREENRRLLYVALTRARDGMILCGRRAKKKTDEPWFEYAQAAMQRLNAKAENDIWRYGQNDVLVPPPAKAAKTPVNTVELPAWARRAPATETRQTIINPSDIAHSNEAALPPFTNGKTDNYLRGTILHRLLQFLPDIPADAREETALGYLIRQTNQSHDDCRRDASEVLRIMNDPIFAPIFSAQSRAEVPLAGRLNGRPFSGQVDRLYVSDTEVWVVDYKTNRPPPTSLADVPENYLAQMAAYAQLLAQIYPAKHIRCALLWTHLPKLMELDSAALARGAAILNKAA